MGTQTAFILRKERGERLQQLREALGLSRKEFCEKHGLSIGTLQGWEYARWGGLTKNGAEKLVMAFKAHGVETVTVEWLMDGVGPAPLNFAQSPVKPPNSSVEIEKIKELLKLFHKLYDNAIDLVVADDGLSPCLNPGDFVAGEKLFGDEIKNAVGHPCIIQTQDYDVLIRLLEHGDEADHFTLICTNQSTTVTKPFIENIKLISAAPILLIRKPKVISNTSPLFPSRSALQHYKIGKMQTA